MSVIDLASSAAFDHPHFDPSNDDLLFSLQSSSNDAAEHIGNWDFLPTKPKALDQLKETDNLFALGGSTIESSPSPRSSAALYTDDERVLDMPQHYPSSSTDELAQWEMLSPPSDASRGSIVDPVSPTANSAYSAAPAGAPESPMSAQAAQRFAYSAPRPIRSRSQTEHANGQFQYSQLMPTASTSASSLQQQQQQRPHSAIGATFRDTRPAMLGIATSFGGSDIAPAPMTAPLYGQSMLATSMYGGPAPHGSLYRQQSMNDMQAAVYSPLRRATLTVAPSAARQQHMYAPSPSPTTALSNSMMQQAVINGGSSSVSESGMAISDGLNLLLPNGFPLSSASSAATQPTIGEVEAASVFAAESSFAPHGRAATISGMPAFNAPSFARARTSTVHGFFPGTASTPALTFSGAQTPLEESEQDSSSFDFVPVYPDGSRPSVLMKSNDGEQSGDAQAAGPSVQHQHRQMAEWYGEYAPLSAQRLAQAGYGCVHPPAYPSQQMHEHQLYGSTAATTHAFDAAPFQVDMHGRPLAGYGLMAPQHQPAPSSSNGSAAGGSGKFANNGRILLACSFCKARKLKCDGQGPKCGQCAKRGMDCAYPTTVRRRGKAKKTKAKEAAELLRKQQAEAKASGSGQASPSKKRSRSVEDDGEAARSGSGSDGEDEEDEIRSENEASDKKVLLAVPHTVRTVKSEGSLKRQRSEASQ